MKVAKQVRTRLLTSLGALAACLLSASAFGQCGFGPVSIICHKDKGVTAAKCCDFLPVYGCSVDPTVPNQPGWNGTYVRNAVTAQVLTCGGGTTALSATSFTGTCGWNDGGVDCGVVWGPVPNSAPVDLYSCEGTCPH